MKIIETKVTPQGHWKLYVCGLKICSFKIKKNKNADDYGLYRPYISLSLVPDFIANKDVYDKIDKPRLLANLDAESYRTIMEVLNKYEYLCNGGSKDLLETSEQIKYSNTVVKNFIHSIKDIGGEIYQYNNFILPIRHFETSVFLDEHGLNKFNFTIGKGVIIDVGTYIGDSILVFKKHFPNNKVIGFEGTNSNYQMALQTMELNNISNVVVENLALGDKRGTLAISSDSGSGNSYEFACLSKNIENCKMETLDNYVLEHKIDKVELIKVDIEGAEQLFIKGALETIKRDRPIILMSIYHNYDDLMHIKPLFEDLNLGYTYKIHKPIDTIFNEILLVCIPAKK